MTCIVAEKKDGVIYMAGDKLGSDSSKKMLVSAPKIFINNEFIIGYTTSFRIGQLLQYSWEPPQINSGQSKSNFIYKTVVESIKKLFVDDGISDKKSCGNFIFGYDGMLFVIQNDYSVFEIEEYTAVGVGDAEAKSVLFALNKIKALLPMKERLGLAIEASSNIRTGVSKEFDYLTL